MQERGLVDGVVVGGGGVAWLVTALVIDIGDGRARVEAGRKLSGGILQQLRLPSGHSGFDGRLSRDFSAKSLTRKGGFYLVYTSDMQDHLTFASKNSCGYSISLLH